MSTKNNKGRVFMTSFYTVAPTKWHKYSGGSKQDGDQLKKEIAKNFSDQCTKSLLKTIYRMNKEITHIITTDLGTKGLK